MKNIITLLILVLTIAACSNKTQLNTKPLSQADQIIKKAYDAHGSQKLDKTKFQFIFRKKQYTVENDRGNYTYELEAEKEGKVTKEKLTNDGMRRWVNGSEIPLSKKDQIRFSGGVNSVVYFATLPHKLYDPAVNKSYVGTQRIQDKNYHVLEITFDKEGGGMDHEDMYYYWIGEEDNLINFIAYNYIVNGGGVRLRSVSDRQNIGGVVFQDYINYKAEVGTPLSELPGLWEEGKLKELSRINTESVRFISK